MKKILVWLVIIVIVSLLFSSVILAVEKTVTWTANIESDLAGYEIHYGESTGNYTVVVVVSKTFTAYTIGGLEEGKEYFIALKAFDTSGNLSDFGAEVSTVIPISDTEPPLPTIINIPAGSPVNINIGK